MVVLDLCSVPQRVSRRIPLSYWYRFRLAIENTPSILLLVEQEVPEERPRLVLVADHPGAIELEQGALERQPVVILGQDARSRNGLDSAIRWRKLAGDQAQERRLARAARRPTPRRARA